MGAVLFGLKAPVIKKRMGPRVLMPSFHHSSIHTMLETQVVPQLVEYYEGKAE